MNFIERIFNKQDTPSDEFLLMILILGVPMLVLFVVHEFINHIKQNK